MTVDSHIVGLAMFAILVVLLPFALRLVSNLRRHFPSKRLRPLQMVVDSPAPPPAHFTGWSFCPLCASPLHAQEVCERQRLACSNKVCNFVHWENPKPVALCLVELDGGLVLTRRKFAPKVGTWCIPGGFVEAHESPELAAKRETWEETGLLVEITNLLGVYSPCQGANEIVIVYSARAVGGALNKGDEVLELGVFKEDQLPTDIGFPQHLEIIQYWFKGALKAKGIDPANSTCETGSKDRSAISK